MVQNIFCSKIPLGNFGPPFKKKPFVLGIFRLGKGKTTFHFYSDQNFWNWNFGVNGNQPETTTGKSFSLPVAFFIIFLYNVCT